MDQKTLVVDRMVLVYTYIEVLMMDNIEMMDLLYSYYMDKSVDDKDKMVDK